MDRTTLFSRPFAHPSLANFLSTYYAGRVAVHSLGDAPFEVAKCNRCGFVWQVYILSDEWMFELYETWTDRDASLAKKARANSSLYSGYARQVELIARLLPRRVPSEISVLDFGMGWSYWCLMAKAFGYNVTGSELSQNQVAYARANGIKTLGDVADAKDGQFHFVNAAQVFEHLSAPMHTLKLLVSKIQRNGIVCIDVPNGRSIEAALRDANWNAAKGPIQPLEHINCFTHKTLTAFGERAGLKRLKQPLQRGYRRNLVEVVKGRAGQFFKRFWGTTAYFVKVG